MAENRSFQVADVLGALGGRLLHGNPETRFSNFCIDSRYVDGNSMFIPLMGQNRDGHQYIIDSITKGAVAALVRSGHHQVHEIISWLRERSNRGYHDLENVCIVEVRHTLVSLQKVAEWYRKQFNVKVIAITGSVGKTGTKEMLIQLLSEKFHAVGTEKNFNNEIGVPLALAKIDARTDIAVVEMAMRARGEISLLSRIAAPDMAVITNTAGSHVGRLGSFDEVYKAKCEIIDGLKEGGLVVLNRRDANLLQTIEELETRNPSSTELQTVLFDASDVYRNSGVHPFTTPGIEAAPESELPPADVWVEDVKMKGLEGSTFAICTADDKVEVKLNMLGRGAVENFTAAAAVCISHGMQLKELAAYAPNLLPAPQRLNLFQLRDNIFLIDDCYNSSPASAQDSLELMMSIDPRFRKILIIGDMLELGKFETLLHRQYALNLLNAPFDAVFAVGPRMNAVNEIEVNEDIDLYYIDGRSDLGGTDGQANGARFGDSFGEPGQARRTAPSQILDDRAASKLSALLLNQLNQDDKESVILVKGSRALHLERIVNDLLSGTDY
jgi:UDP-N-acetylmuramoyl-tripeptide--D-alanyl-D-alanine ligase